MGGETSRQSVLDAHGDDFHAIAPDEITLGRKLGHGVSGDVFEAQWQRRSVAVKIAKATLSEAFLKEFRAEASLLSKLRHPNIIMFYGLCAEPGQLMIITELASEGSLDTYLRRNRCDLVRKSQILFDVACGMNYLVTRRPRQVLHCDLKLTNVLLTSDGSAKLADFGLASLRRAEAGLAAAVEGVVGLEGGTPAYMAPELFKRGNPSEKTDCFSFGVLAWEVLTEQEAWIGYDLDTIARLVTGRQRPPVPPNLDPTLAALIRRCWAEDPNARPTFEEVLDILEPYTGRRSPREAPEDATSSGHGSSSHRAPPNGKFEPPAPAELGPASPRSQAGYPERPQLPSRPALRDAMNPYVSLNHAANTPPRPPPQHQHPYRPESAEEIESGSYRSFGSASGTGLAPRPSGTHVLPSPRLGPSASFNAPRSPYIAPKLPEAGELVPSLPPSPRGGAVPHPAAPGQKAPSAAALAAAQAAAAVSNKSDKPSLFQRFLSGIGESSAPPPPAHQPPIEPGPLVSPGYIMRQAQAQAQARRGPEDGPTSADALMLAGGYRGAPDLSTAPRGITGPLRPTKSFSYGMTRSNAPGSPLQPPPPLQAAPEPPPPAFSYLATFPLTAQRSFQQPPAAPLQPPSPHKAVLPIPAPPPVNMPPANNGGSGFASALSFARGQPSPQQPPSPQLQSQHSLYSSTYSTNGPLTTIIEQPVAPKPYNFYTAPTASSAMRSSFPGQRASYPLPSNVSTPALSRVSSFSTNNASQRDSGHLASNIRVTLPTPPPPIPISADDATRMLARYSVDLRAIRGNVDLSRRSLRDSGVSDVARVLPLCSELRSISFSSNAITEPGARALSSALLASPVTALDVSGNPLGPAGVRWIAGALGRGSPLVLLNLSECSIDADGAEYVGLALASCPTLRELHIAGNPIRERGARHLADGLQTNRSMTRLNLRLCKTKLEGTRALLRAVQAGAAPALEEITLAGNKIPDEGLEAVAGAIRSGLCALSSVDLSDNPFHREHAVRGLAAAIGASGYLRRLSLANCRIGDSGAEAMAEAVRTSPSLRVLNLSGCSITKRGADAMASALRSNHTLEVLRLGGNKFADAGVESLCEGLIQNARLVSIGLDALALTDRAGAAVARVLQANRSLLEVDLAANRIREKGVLQMVNAASGRQQVALYLRGNECTGRVREAVDRARGQGPRVEVIF